MDTGLPDNIFDAIVMVSTIEHIGLSVYGQLTLDDDGDIKCMRELHRIMKPSGLLILTTPYTGQTLRISKFERNYNRKRLTKLINGFHILKEEYFYPMNYGRRLIWVKLSRESIDEKAFKNPGLACLVLQKPEHMVYLQ